MNIKEFFTFNSDSAELSLTPEDRLFLENYNSKSGFKLFILNILNNLSLLRYKSLAFIIKYSKILGLYNFLKFFYKKLF